MRFMVGNQLRARAHGLPFWVDLRDTVISFEILARGVYEPEETALFQKLIRPGDRVVDVGANIGYYTVLFASLAGTSGRVLALEPDPENATLLQRNVRLSGFEPTVCVKIGAAAAARGQLPLYRSPYGNRGDHRTYESFAETAGGRRPRDRINVEAFAIDDCVADWERVDVVKMDIQGYEMHALSGMTRTLERSPAMAIVTEFFPDGIVRAGCDPDAYLEAFLYRGFSIWEIGEGAQLRQVLPTSLIGRLAGTGGYTNLVAEGPAGRRLGADPFATHAPARP
jgi:FkbM family methyltransferase